MIWCMHIACWIPKATNAHTGCVVLIPFPLQQWLHKYASMLRYTYIACLVFACVQVTYILVNYDFVKKFIVHVMSYMEAHCGRLQVQYHGIARDYPPEGCYYQLLK
jgi:hypothetical protein